MNGRKIGNLILPVLRCAIFGLTIAALPASPLWAAAVSWIGGDGNWNDGTKWSSGAQPAAGDDVTINAAVTVTVTAQTNTIQSLTVTGGATITLGNSAGDNLRITGGVAASRFLSVDNATINVPTNSNITVTGGGNSSISNGGSINLTSSGDLLITGNLNMTGATSALTMSAANGVITITGNLDIDAGTMTQVGPNGDVITVTGTLNIDNGGKLVKDATGNDLIVDGNITIGGVGGAGTIELHGDNFDMSGGAGNLTIANNGKLLMDSTDSRVQFGTGTWVDNGDNVTTGLVATAGRVEFNTNGGKIGSNAKFWTIRINADTTINAGPYTIECLEPNNDPTLGRVGIEIRNAGTVLTANDATIKVRSWYNNGVGATGFAEGTSTVVFLGNSDVPTVDDTNPAGSANETFYSLTAGEGANDSAIAIVGTGNLPINGNLTIGTANSALSNSLGRTIVVEGNWSNSGSYTGTGDTVQLGGVNNDAGTVSGTTTFRTLNVNAGDTYTLANGASVTCVTTFNNAGTFNGSPAVGQSATLQIESTCATTLGTFDPKGGTFIWKRNDGAANLPNNGGTGYYNLTVDPGGGNTVTATGGLTIANDFTISSGTFNASNQTHLIGGDLRMSGAFTQGTSTVTFTGSDCEILKATSAATSITFATLTIGNGAGDATTIAFGKSAVVATAFSIAGSSTFNLGTSTVLTTGTWTDSGTFNRNTGSVVWTGSTLPVTAAGNAHETFYNLTIDSGTAALNYNLTVTNNLKINGTRTLDAENGGGNTLYIGKDWENDGTFTARDSTVEFNGSSAQTIKGLAATAFNNVVVNKGSDSTVTVSVGIGGDDMSVAGTTQIKLGNLDIGSDQVAATGAVSVGDGVAGAAGLKMLANCTLKLGTSLTVNTDGTLTTSGSTPAITSTNPGVAYYSFTVNGVINIGALTLDYADTNGMTLNAAAGITAFDNTIFDNVQNAGANDTYVRIIRDGSSPAYAYTFNGHIYNNTGGNADWNVAVTTGGFGVTITQDNSSGAMGGGSGETYDRSDGAADATPGSVRWNANYIWQGDDGVAPTDWFDVDNWDYNGGTPATAPGVGTNTDVTVDIPTGLANYPVISGQDVTVKNITIRTAASLTVNASEILTYTNTWTIEGTGNFVPGTGTIVVGGTTNQTLPQETYYNIKITNTTGVSTPPAGIIISGDNFTLDTGAKFNAGSSEIRLSGNWVNLGTFTASTSKVYFEGAGAGTQSIDASDFYDVIFKNSKTKEINGDLNVDGTMTIEDGATVNATTLAAINVNIAKNLRFQNTDADTATSGTFSPGLSTVIFDGLASQEIVQENTTAAASTIQFNVLKTQGTGTSVKLVTSVGGATTQAITINTVDNAGNTNKGNVNIGTGSTLDCTNDTINCGGSWTQSGTATSTGSTVLFNASAAQEIKTGANFNNLTIANTHASQKVSVTAPATSTLTASGTLQVTDGILNLGTDIAVTITGTTTVSNGASIEVAKSTLTMNDTPTINGTLTLTGDAVDASIVKIGGGAQKTLTVSNTGTFSSTTTGIQPKITAVDTTNGPFYQFTVDGTITVSGLDFEASGNNGLNISNTATITDIDNVDFQSLNGGAAINQAFSVNVTSGTYNFDGCTFDSTCTKNCAIPGGWTGTAINFTNFSGANSGSAFETDTPNKINWISNRTWVGGDAGNLDEWNRGNNWTPTGTPNADTNVTIPNQTYDPKVDGARSSRYITVQNGAILYLDNTYSATPTLTVGSDFTIEAGGEVRLLTNNAAITVNGNWTGGGTLTQTTGTITFGGANGVINSEAAFSRVTINGTSVTLGDGAVVICTQPNTLGHAFTINAGRTFGGGTNTNPATFQTDVWTNNGNAFVPGNSKFRWMGASTANDANDNGDVPVETYYDLEIGDGVAAVDTELRGNITVGGNLRIRAGSTLDLRTFTLTLNGNLIIDNTATLNCAGATVDIKGNVTIDGTFTKGTSTFNFNATSGTQTISGAAAQPFDFNTVSVVGTSTLSIGGNVKTAGFTLNGVVDLNNYELQITGTLTDGQPNADNITEDQGTLYFNGTAQTLPTTGAGVGETFYNLKTGAIATYTLGGTTTVTNNVDIGINSTFSVSGSNYALSVGGNWTRTGSFTEGTGTVTFNGSGNQNITTAADFYNLAINNSGSGSGYKVLAQSAITQTAGGTLTMTQGRFELDTDGGGSLSHTLRTITAGGGVLDFSDADVTATGAVTINGGATAGTLDLTASPSGATISFGSVTIGAGAVLGTLNMTGSSATVSVGGNWSDSGTFNAGSGTIKFTANGSTITASGSGDFYKVEIAPGGGNTVSLSSNIGVDNNVTVTNGTLAVSNRTLAVAGAVSNSGTVTIGTVTPAAGTLDLEGNFSGGTLTFINTSGSLMKFAGATFAPATLNANDGTVRFDNTGTGQDVPSFTYNNLEIAKTAQTATAVGNITTNGTLTVTTGVFNADDASDRAHTFNALTNNGTVTIDRAGTSVTVTNLLDNNGTMNIGSGAVDGNGNVDTTGGTLSFNGLGGTLRVAGTFTSTNGELVEGNGTVIFDGAGQTIPGLTYYHLKTGNVTTTYSLGGDIVVTGNLTNDETVGGNTATLDVTGSNRAIAVGGDFTNNGTFTAQNGTVTLNGSGAAIAIKSNGSALKNLVVNVGATSVVTPSDGMTVGGTLTLSGGELNLGTGLTHTITGTSGVSKKLNVNGSTVRCQANVTVNAGGELALGDGGVMRLDNGVGVTIASGAPNGILSASYTTTKPEMTGWPADGTARFALAINGTVDIDGLTVTYPDDNGMTVNAGATLTSINDVTWNNVSGTGTYLRILLNGAGTYVLSKHVINGTFSGPPPYNVATAATAGLVIDMVNSSGNGGGIVNGPANDNPGAGSTINWKNTNNWTAGAATTSWNTAGNWSEGHKPLDTEDVLIPVVGGGIYPVMDVAGDCRNITVDAAGPSLDLNGNTLRVKGNFTNDGTFTHNNGTVEFTGTTQQTIGGAGAVTLYHLVVDNTSATEAVKPTRTITVAGNLNIKEGRFGVNGQTVNVTGNVTVGSGVDTTNGTLDATGGSIDVTGNVTNTTTYGTITFGAAGTGTMKIRGGTFTGGGAFTAGNGTVILRDNNFTDVPAVTYYNLTLENDGDGTTEVFTLDGNITVNNALTIQALTQLQNYDGVTQWNITVGGAWTNSGVFTPTGGTVTFNGGSATITPGSGANDNFYNLTVNSTGTKTVATNPLDVDGNLSISAGTLDLAAITAQTVAGTATFSAGKLDVGTGSITITGALDNTGTVDMDQNAAALVCGSFTNNVGGTLDFGAGSTAALTCNGAWSDAGTTNPGNSTVTLAGTGVNVTSMNSTDFYNVTISGTYTAAGNLDIEGSVTISNSLDPSSYTIKVAGGWNDSAGTFNATAGKVIFDGTGARTLTLKAAAGGNAFYALDIGDATNAPSVTTAAGGDLIVANNLAIKTGSVLTLNANAAHAVAGTLTLTGGTTTVLNISTGKLTVTGAASNTGKIDLSSTASTAQGLWSGAVTNNETITFGAGGLGMLSINGSFNNSGANSLFTKGASTLTVGGSSTTINAPPAKGALNHVTIDGTVSAVSNLDIDGSLTVNSGKTFSLGSSTLVHDVAGTVTATGTLNVNNADLTVNGNVTVAATTGILQMGDASKLRMANGTSVTVNGTLTTSYATTRPKITSTNPGTNRYGFTLNGKAAVVGLTFESANSSGFTISSTADPANVDLDNVDFKTVQAVAGTGQGDGARHLSIGFTSGTFTQTFTSCTFDATFGTSAPNVGNNVVGASTTGSTVVSFASYGGAGSGPTYEWESNDADTKIQWLGTTQWEGNNSTDWNDNGNWSNGAPGSESTAIIVFPASARNPVMNVDGTCASLEIKTNGNLDVNGKILTVAGNFTLQATGTLTMTTVGSAVNVSGNWTHNGGTLNQTNGTITFNGTGSVITGETGFKTVTLADNKTAQIGTGAAATSVTVSGGTLTIGAGATLTVTNQATLTSSAMTVTGNFTANTGSSFVWIGSGAVPALTYDNLNVGDGATAVSTSLSGSYTVNNDLTVNVPNTYALDAGSASVTVKRHLIFNQAGTFTPSTANFTLDGGVVQNIQGTASPYSLNDLTIGNGTTVSLQSGLTLATSGADYGDLSTAGTGIVKLNSYTLTIQGTWTDNAGADNLSEDTGTVYYNNDDTGAGVNIPDETYKHVRFGTGVGVDNDTYILSNPTVVSGNVTIDANATFDVSGSNHQLSVGGNWTRNGSFTERAGTVVFNGSGDQNIATAADFNNVQINNSGSGVKVLAQGALTIGGTVTMTLGRFELDNDDGTRLSHTIAAITANGGVLDFSNADVAVSGAVTINGGATAGTLDLTMSSAATVSAGSVTIGAGATPGTLTMTGSTGTVSVGGNWSDSGTFNVGSGTIKFTANGSTITASGSGDFYNLEVAPGGGNTVSLSSNIGVNNNLVITSGTMGMGTRTMTVGGSVDANAKIDFGTAGILDVTGGVDYSGTGILDFTNGGRLQMEGALTTGGTLTEGTGTIEFDGTAAQNIPAETYNNVEVDKGTGTGTAVGNLTINGTLTVTTGTFNADDASDRTHSLGALTNNGTVTIDRAGTSVTVTNLLDNNGTLNIGDGTVDGNGNVDTTGGTLSFNGLGGTLRIAGTLTSTNGELVEGNGTVIFDGAGQTIPGLTYYHLKTGNVTTTYSLGGDIVVTKNLTNDETVGGNTATLDVTGSNRAIAVGGDFTNNGTFTAQNGTVTLNGSAAAIAIKSNGSALKNLVVNVGATSVVTPSDGMTVGGTLTLSGGELNLGTGLTHTITGASSVSKKMNVNGSTVRCQANVTVNAGGELALGDGGVMRLDNGVGITIASGAPNGILSTSYTTTKPEMTGWPADGTARFALTINGTVDVGGLTVTYPDDNGMTVNAGATLTSIDEVTWNNVSGTGTYLRILLNGAGTYVLSKHVINGTFSGPPPYNVATAATAGLVVDMVNSSGNGGGTVNGPNHDNPGAGSAINWKQTNNWTAGAATTSWNNTANWSEGHIPLDTEDVLIPVVGSGIYPVLDIANGDCRNITIDPAGGSTPSLNLNGNTLRVKGNITIDGTFTHGNGTLAFVGSAQQTIGGAGTITLYHLTVDNTSATDAIKPTKTITIAGNLDIKEGMFAANGQTVNITGNVTAGNAVDTTNGTLRMLSGTIIVDGSVTNTATYGTVSFGAAGTGTLRLRGAGTLTGTGTFTAGNGTVEYTGKGDNGNDSKNIAAVTYYHLKLVDDNDGVEVTEKYTLAGNIVVNGDLTIQTDTELENRNGVTDYDIDVKGAWTSNGLFTPIGGKVTFSGGSATVTPGSGANDNFYNVEVNSTGTKTVAGNPLDVDGTLTMTAGTLDLGAGFTGASKHVVDGAAFPSVDINVGTLKLGTSELEVSNAAGGVDIAASNSAKIDMTANSAADPDLDVAGNFTINGGAQNGTLDMTGSSATVRVYGSWTDGGTYNIGSSGVTLAGATKNITTPGNADFNNIAITGTYTAQNGLDVDGNMTVTGTFTAGTFAHKVAGNWDDSGGTFVQTSGSVTFDKVSGAQTITTDTGSTNNRFYNLLIGDGTNKPAVTVTAGDDLEVANNLTVKVDSSLMLNANLVHTVGGTVTIEAPSAGTTELEISTGKLTVAGAVTNSGRLDMGSTSAATQGLVSGGLTSTGTLVGGVGTFECNGNWSNTGAFTLGTSTVKIGGVSTIRADAATADFYNLTINGTVTMNGAAVNGLDIDGALQIESGKSLTLDEALSHDVAGTSTLTGTLTLNGGAALTARSTVTVTASTGGLTMGDNGTLKLANAVSVAVNGTFTTTYATTKPKVTGITPGTDRYAFAVNSGATINVAGLTFESPDANGLTINQGATITDIDNAAFTNIAAAAGSAFLKIQFTSGTYAGNYDSCSFAALVAGKYNVVTANTTGSTTINLTNWSGAGAGDTYHSQGTSTNIYWIADATWQGNVSTAWDDGANWSTGNPPGAGANVIIPAKASTNNRSPTLPAGDSQWTVASLVIQNEGELVMSGLADLTVNGNLTIDGGATGGKINQSNGGSILKARSNFVDNTTNGGVNQTAGKVIIDAPTVNINASDFLNLEVGSGTSATDATLPNGKKIKISAGGTLRVKTQGIFRVTSGTVELGNGASLTIDNGGSLIASGTAKITTTTPGTDRFNCNISGTVNIDGLTFESAETSGMNIQSNATVTKLRSVTFNNVKSAGSHLTIAVAAINMDMPKCKFSAMVGGSKNVTATGAGTILRFDDRDDATNGAGRGDANDADDDANEDGVADGGGAVVLWLYTSNLSITGNVVGFPVLAFDFDTGNYYSTYVGSVDISGTNTADRVYVLDANGDLKNYSYDIPQSYGNIVGMPWAWEEGNNNYFVYVGTSNGYILKLRDTLAALTLEWDPAPQVADEITSSILMDGTNLYFGCRIGANYYIFAYIIASRAELFNPRVQVPSAIKTTSGWDTNGGDTYLFNGSESNGLYRTKVLVNATTDNNTTPAAAVRAAVSVINGRLHVGDIGGMMHGVPAFPPTAFSSNLAGWPYNAGAVQITTGAYVYYVNNYVYFGESAGKLHIVKPDGTSYSGAYPKQLEAVAINSTPLPRGGLAYIGNNNGKLYVVDESTGNVFKTFDFGTGVQISTVARDPDNNRLVVGGVKDEGGGNYTPKIFYITITWVDPT